MSNHHIATIPGLSFSYEYKSFNYKWSSRMYHKVKILSFDKEKHHQREQKRQHFKKRPPISVGMTFPILEVVDTISLSRSRKEQLGYPRTPIQKRFFHRLADEANPETDYYTTLIYVETPATPEEIKADLQAINEAVGKDRQEGLLLDFYQRIWFFQIPEQAPVFINLLTLWATVGSEEYARLWERGHEVFQCSPVGRYGNYGDYELEEFCEALQIPGSDDMSDMRIRIFKAIGINVSDNAYYTRV